MGVTTVAATTTGENSYQRLRRLLDELFQFDQADLDFGIYRIMNQKRAEISRFLDEDLLPQVQSILTDVRAGKYDAVQSELDKLRYSLQAAGVSPETSPRYRELQDQLAALGTGVELENEVYSDLYTFFRRYYKEGDFISLRRYKAGVYAIPYEGEEVKLHWANADQYYVKTTEAFQDYRFRLPDGRHVHFRIVVAETERDNNKSNGEERRFVLLEIEPSAEVEGELHIYFQYQPSKEKQKDLNEQVVTKLIAMPELRNWRDALMTPQPTAANKGRTLLGKHLSDYTARNAFDYFIHKDLRSFLRRELDFFLKNEVAHLDDLDMPDELSADQYLARLRAIKRIARKIIDFLAQLEDFQKRLFLKKKFVVSTEYCMTLDHVPVDLHDQIVANDEQWAEWERLFSVSELPSGSDRVSVLQEHPNLLLDTRFFDIRFKQALLNSIEDIDSETDGLLLNAENFQALNLLKETFRESIKCIYIDPPYNTGEDGFLYKDRYLHSSWLSMMADRLLEARTALSDDGVLIVSIGREELFHLQLLCDQTLGAENRIADLVWEKGRKNDAKYFSLGHDYLLVYAKDAAYLRSRKTVWREEKPGADEILAEYRRLQQEFKDNFQTIREKLLEFYKSLPKEHPALKHRRYNRVDSNGIWRDDNMSWPGGNGPTYDVIHPKTGLPCKVPDGGWRFATYEKFKLYQDHGFIEFRGDHTEPPILKRYLNYVSTDFDPDARRRSAAGNNGDEQDGNVQVMPSVFYKSQQPTVVELRNILGHNAFSNPKDPEVLARLIRYVSGASDATLDFFAGSGTTGHAVINLNREDSGNRKYILVEMGEYFDSVLKPRILKAAYSKDWKAGKPVSREGASHLIKYLTLESYEDTLNNLHLRERPQAQQQLLEQSAAAREDYVLSYCLDTETVGSASLLDVERFSTPFDYKLIVTQGGENCQVDVDLPETFNYLLGLRVRRVRTVDGFQAVEGTDPEQRKVLIVWRTITDISADNDALERFFTEQGYADQEGVNAIDCIYVNGDNTLLNLRPEGASWQVFLTEGEFKRLMFASVGEGGL